MYVYREVAPTVEFEGIVKLKPEEHWFLAVELLQYDFVLGILWLHAIDPIIEWRIGE